MSFRASTRNPFLLSMEIRFLRFFTRLRITKEQVIFLVNLSLSIFGHFENLYCYQERGIQE